MNISLEGKNAVICGSTQGIGLAIAKEFALSGANCILLARNQNELQKVMAELTHAKTQAHRYKVADFADTAQVDSAIKTIVQETNVHILVNNTGGPKAGAIENATAKDFEDAFAQHVVNNQLLTQAVLPGMKYESYGRIINIISTSVKVPITNLGVSNTIRAAVASWAKTLSNEVGKYNITVNNILPGSTRTARLDSLIQSIAHAKKVDVAVIEKEMMEAIPMKRFGLPEETANLAAFLASPAAAYINGTSIRVDGGRTGSI